MSYILDALRKSDQQRQRGAAPTLQTARTVAHASKQPAWLVYGVLGAMLVATGILIGWMRPWQLTRPAPVAAPGATQSLESPPRQIAADSSLPEATAISGTPDESPARQSRAGSSRAAVPTHSVLTPESRVPARTHTRPHEPAGSADSAGAKTAVVPAPAMPADAAGTSGATQERRVLTRSELPAALRHEIPPMAISVHAYSPRPADRMVSINERVLREGGTLPPGLTLDEITPDGMIFSYKGYRFRHGLGGAGAAAKSR